jgi:lysophospholipase L1-like esterase
MRRRLPTKPSRRLFRWTTWLIVVIGMAAILVVALTHYLEQPARHTTPKSRTRPAATQTQTPKHMVSLGDSITFGEHLPGSKLNSTPGALGTPSPEAYPFLVAKQEHWYVTDLGIPGDTSADLLQALNRKPFHDALKQADVITLDIGSNDLIQSAYTIVETMMANPGGVSPDTENASFENALDGFAKNLPQIIAAIRKQTNAPIVMMTLYDPFADHTSLHDITEPLLAKANDTILQQAMKENCAVANTYTVMDHRQSSLIRTQDIHPTRTGQQGIAQAVEATLAHPANYKPHDYAVIPAGVPIIKSPALLAPSLLTTPSQQMLQVTGTSDIWLKVQLQGLGGAQGAGYVKKSSVKLVIRPWTVEKNQTIATMVKMGVLKGPKGASSVVGFQWHGTAYAPANEVANLADATASWQPDVRLMAMTTQDSSGITSASAKRSTLTLQPLSQGNQGNMKMTLHVEGALLQIDGEPVHLNQPILIVGDTAYLPVKAVWQALGGK